MVESNAAMGGVQWSTVHLAAEIDRCRWAPIVLAPEPGDLSAECERVGVEVKFSPVPTFRSTSIQISHTRRIPDLAACARNLGALRQAAARFERLLHVEKPDVVLTKGLLTHGWAGMAARRAGVPCVWHVQDLISERYAGLFRRAFAFGAARWADQIVVDGGAIARQLPARMQNRVRVILNGIDTQQYRPGLDGSAVREELRIPANALVIGSVARFTPWKGQHHLVDAFARIAPGCPLAILLLVGAPVFDSDGYERQLRAMVERAGLEDRVVFSGYRSDLPAVLSAIDVFVHTSVDKDTSPLALLSAMACGKAIAAFDIEGVREVIEAGTEGVLARCGDTASLAEVLLSMTANREMRDTLGAGARARALRCFSLQQHAEAMERALNQAVDGHAAQATP